MTGFVYLAQPDDMQVFKLGHTSDPAQRLGILQGQTPHVMRYVRMLDVGCVYRAKAFEAFCHSWLMPFAAHGEWISCPAAANAVMDCVAPCVDVTDDFVGLGEERRKIQRTPISLAELQKRIERADWRRAEAVASGAARAPLWPIRPPSSRSASAGGAPSQTCPRAFLRFLADALIGLCPGGLRCWRLAHPPERGTAVQ